MAGEIVAVGVDVKGWKTGDRVCSNFATEHLHGDIDNAIQQSSLGGQSHGVLTEYRTFPSYVRFPSLDCRSIAHLLQSLVSIPQHLSYEEASTLP